MYIITKETNSEPLKITHQSWKGFAEKPETHAFLSLIETGFKASFKVFENNPKRVHTSHFSPVHTDSCVEWFVNFAPTLSDKYFNFEVNAAGAMNVAFRLDRYNITNLTEEEVLSFNITPVIHDGYWEVSYEIPFSFIEKYIPGYKPENNTTIKTNMYKCGDETEAVHYLSLFHIGHPQPDFHRPEYFAEMQIEF